LVEAGFLLGQGAHPKVRRREAAVAGKSGGSRRREDSSFATGKSLVIFPLISRQKPPWTWFMGSILVAAQISAQPVGVRPLNTQAAVDKICSTQYYVMQPVVESGTEILRK
jgi:hypothetical protein